MIFNEKFIEELKNKNNIVDVVGGYCGLRKRGNSHWACCPLPGHSEKTPSFTVNESGQFFKCFGCLFIACCFKFVKRVNIQLINRHTI